MQYRTGSFDAVALGAVLWITAALPAWAATTFSVGVEGDTIVVYSTSDKDIACYTMVTFSYRKGDERESTRYTCNGFARALKDFRFCARTDPRYIDVRIESSVTSYCG
jgi:hypothetical protein